MLLYMSANLYLHSSVEKARQDNSVILIHCMAGISRSVTVTIAYIMAYFNMSMQDAYQYVKDKRPAISPNLNFMGQLVEFERHCQENGPKDKKDITPFNPTLQQQALSKKLMEKIVRSGSTVSLTGKTHVVFETSKSIDKGEPEGGSGGGGGGIPVSSNKPFVLKPLNPKSRKSKKSQEHNPSTVVPANVSSLNEQMTAPSEQTATSTSKEQSSIHNNTTSTGNNNDNNSVATLPSSESSSPRPKSPRQLTVLSIKGEKMNLQNRSSNDRRSPSPVDMRATSPANSTSTIETTTTPSNITVDNSGGNQS